MLGRLRRLQERMARRVIVRDDFGKIRTVAGADASYFGGSMAAVIAVCDYETMKLLESAHSISRVSFPYIPGYLSFREAPGVMRAFARLRKKPDILLVNGVGIAHPRGCGLASYLGIRLGVPTIGVTKGVLSGKLSGNSIMMMGRKVGLLLRRRGFAPLVVTPGHRVGLASSMRIVKKCMRKGRLPEPLALADRIANGIRQEKVKLRKP